MSPKALELKGTQVQEWAKKDSRGRSETLRAGEKDVGGCGTWWNQG